MVPLVAAALIAIAFASPVLGSASAQGDATGEDNLPRYWQIHAALLTVGTILIIAAYGALWLKMLGKLEVLGFPAIATRISRFWYKWHMYMGAVGVAFALAGVAWGYLMVQWAHGGTHLRLPHSYIGIATGVVVSAPLITGFVARAIRKKRTAIRWWHVALGLVVIGMMLAGLFSGWAIE